MSDDDRPRKSWREIDKARDGSSHRRDERPGGSSGRGAKGRSQKSYRSALDRLFDSGKIGDLVQQKDPTAKKPEPEGGESRLKLHKKIKAATDRDDLTRTVDGYLKKFELPDDHDVLGRVLEHRDPGVQRDAMERIAALLETTQPKRARAMVGQLKMIRDFADDPEMESLATKIIERLD